MESPESGNGAGNCSVGSIVWVRRRNGSWWPGKILGPDELSASHVISPRSGTPVKLLGREDASVDWYNLEKSKRVKAFRCGDFDDCIERAEASQSMPPKKREKYARREDAIVHALELERQMLENKCEEVDCSSNLKGGNLQLVAVKEPTLPSEYLDSRNEGKLSPITEGGKVLSLSNEHVSKDKDLYPRQVKEENRHHVTGDDNSVAIPKMGGSMGYGLRSGHSSLKNPRAIPPNGSDKSLPENGSSLHDGFSTNGAVNDHYENSSDKRKRSPEGQIEEPLAKRHDRHQPTGHVRTNSAKVPVSVLQHDNSVNSMFKSEEEQTGIAHPAKGIRHTSLTSEGKPGLCNTKALLTPIEAAPLNCMQASNAYEGNTIESTEDTETDSSETDSLDSDSDDLASLSEGAASIELQPKYPGRSKPQQEYGSLSSDDLEDTSHPDEPCHPLLGNDPASTGVGVGVSRWQLKGKRNNRSLLKRPTLQTGTKFRSLLAGYEPRSPDGGIATPRKAVKWDRWGSDDYQPVSRGYWDDSVEYFDPLVVCRQHNNENRVLLIEVDLKVQSSYQRGHVPLISLMSKIDGRAMVGHPIQVEPLEDGSTDSLLLGTTDDWRPESLGHDTPLPPTWRTARRTAKFRVPRPDLSSTYDERTKNPRYTDGKKSSQKPTKKSSKKTNPSSNQKTRTLSSIASQHRRIGDPKNSILNNNNNNDHQVEGVIKPESLTTGVACIPVKLVFSRLHEELIGRHP